MRGFIGKGEREEKLQLYDNLQNKIQISSAYSDMHIPKGQQ